MNAQVVKRGQHYYINTQVYLGGERQSKTIAVKKYLGLDRPALKREATVLRNQLLEEHRAGKFVQNSRIKLRDHLDEWITYHGKTIKKSTLGSYKQIIANHIKPTLGDLRLLEITPKHIKDLHSIMETAKLSNTTIRYTHTILKAALASAVDDHLIGENPARKVKPPQKETPTVSYLDWSDAEKLLNATKNDRYYLFYSIALRTGMAKSEILGLRWSDIDLESKTLAVHQTWINAAGGNYFQQSAKTKNRLRTIDISDELVRELEEHREKQLVEIEALGLEDTGLVLQTTTGKPVGHGNIDRVLARTKTRLNLPHFTAHSLRHTHATKLLQANVHPKIVSERLGHSSVQITLDTYSHACPRLQKEAAQVTDLL